MSSSLNRLHVYTGEGKGKTTAAMGLALRAAGHGGRVLVAQFLKKGNSGELIALGRLDNVCVMTAKPVKSLTSRMNETEKRETREEQTGFARAVDEKIRAWQPGMVILDELGITLALDMAEEDVCRRLIDDALASGETAVTGRHVPEWLMEKADYLSRIVAEKHPYISERLPARKGVEW